jgi:hypothetical protein
MATKISIVCAEIHLLPHPAPTFFDDDSTTNTTGHTLEATLLDEARATTAEWWKRSLEPYLKHDGPGTYEPVLAVGSSGAKGVGATGIPFHRHFAAWLVLLHGPRFVRTSACTRGV